jgi:uncharacterized protein YjiS (DUF1127 family)
MLLTSPFRLLRRAYVRWQADRAERAVFRELLAMGPHLLDDIGLSINDVTAALDEHRRRLRHADRLAALDAQRARERPDATPAATPQNC